MGRSLGNQPTSSGFPAEPRRTPIVGPQSPDEPEHVAAVESCSDGPVGFVAAESTTESQMDRCREQRQRHRDREVRHHRPGRGEENANGIVAHLRCMNIDQAEPARRCRRKPESAVPRTRRTVGGQAADRVAQNPLPWGGTSRPRSAHLRAADSPVVLDRLRVEECPLAPATRLPTARRPARQRPLPAEPTVWCLCLSQKGGAWKRSNLRR